MKAIKLLTIVAIAIFIVSCKSGETKNVESATINATADISKTGKHKYEIKSGIVEYQTQTMGTDVAQTLYFDDYGAKEATEISMEIAGIKTNTRSVNIDGYMYSLDLTTKTGTKTKPLAMNGADINFNDLSKEMEKQMNLKKIGTEDFSSKKCDKYTIDNKDFGMKGTFLVWKGVALKSELDLSTIKTTMEATKILENAEIPAEKFIIPADFKITEQ